MVSLGLLDPNKLSHPCDAGFEVFLGPGIEGQVLYLRCDHNTITGHPLPFISAQLQNITLRDAALERVDHDEFQLRHTESTAIPVEDASCDVVVLQIKGEITHYREPLRSLVGEISRIIKPAGELLFLWREQTTCSEEDRTIGTTSLLAGAPKRLAEIAKKMSLALDLRWQHGLQSMLRAQGFSYSEWHLPEYAVSGVPVQVHSLENITGFRGIRNLKRSLQAMSMRTALIRASLNPLCQSILQGTLSQTRAKISNRTPPSKIDSILVSPKEKIVVLAKVGRERVVLRLPFSRHALIGCKQNMKALQGLNRTPRIRSLTPQPIIENHYHSWYFSAESCIDGVPLRSFSQDGLEIELAEGLLRTLNPATEFESATLNGPLFDELIGDPLTSIETLISSDNTSLALKKFFEKAFRGSRVVLGISHGDLSLNNIYIKNRHVSGIIDWDDGSMRGLPILDAVGHLLSRQTRRQQCFSDSIILLAKRDWPSVNELHFLDRLYEYFDLDPSRHFALVMLQWLHIASSQSQHWFGKRKTFAEQYVNSVVEVIANHDIKAAK